MLYRGMECFKPFWFSMGQFCPPGDVLMSGDTLLPHWRVLLDRGKGCCYHPAGGAATTLRGVLLTSCNARDRCCSRMILPTCR